MDRLDGMRLFVAELGSFSAMARQMNAALGGDAAGGRAQSAPGNFDPAIRISDRLDPGDVARRLGGSQGVVVASPDYPQRHGRPASHGTHRARMLRLSAGRAFKLGFCDRRRNALVPGERQTGG